MWVGLRKVTSGSPPIVDVSSGAEFSFSSALWDDNQPNGDGNTFVQDCVVMYEYGNFKLRDMPCNNEYHT